MLVRRLHGSRPDRFQNEISPTIELEREPVRSGGTRTEQPWRPPLASRLLWLRQSPWQRSGCRNRSRWCCLRLVQLAALYRAGALGRDWGGVAKKRIFDGGFVKGEGSQASAIEILRFSRAKLEKLTKISARSAQMGARRLRLVLSVAEVMTMNYLFC